MRDNGKTLGGTEMKIQDLQELLTPEFLSTLHTAVECCNWNVDMIESMEFCKWCYRTAGQPEPEYDMSVEMEDEE
jgi:uncharacterized protein YeaC (DUF1315 family)